MNEALEKLKKLQAEAPALKVAKEAGLRHPGQPRAMTAWGGRLVIVT